MARRIVEAAGAFERYLRTAAAIGPEFDGAAAVSAAVVTSAAYDPRQLEEGAVAYAALAALQAPAFVEALADIAERPGPRAQLVQQLARWPETVLQVEGVDEAAGLASAALRALGSGLLERGKAVRQAAYAVQREEWSLQPVDQPAARLSRVKAQAQARATLTDEEAQQLVAQLVALRSDGAAAPQAKPTPTVLNGLALAALAMLGQAGEDRAEALGPLLADRSNGECLRVAKLNLHQCLAVSGPQYEDVFCAGAHAMADTGQCIVNAAGAPVSRGVRVGVARASRSATAANVSVPVALGGEAGGGQPMGWEARSAYAPRREREADPAPEARPTEAIGPGVVLMPSAN